MKLKASEKLYRSLIESANDAIFIVNLERKIIFCNRKGEELLGYARNRIIDRSIFEFLPSPYPQLISEKLEQAGKGKQSVILEIEVLTSGGKKMVEASGALVEEDGKSYFLGIARDITERKKLERDIVEAKDEIELYLDLMAHDITNKHQVAIGYLEMLVEDSKLGQTQMKYIAKALNSMKESQTLIANIKKLKQLKEATEAEDIDLNNVIEELIKYFLETAPKKVTFEYRAKERIMVTANPLIKDGFYNLIENAIKYSRDKVNIKISVEEYTELEKPFYKTAIEDNGEGIPDELKPKVFERYTRGIVREKGMGLGLYLVRAIIEKFGGKVWVEDRIKCDPTQGSRFNILLPKAVS